MKIEGWDNGSSNIWMKPSKIVLGSRFFPTKASSNVNPSDSAPSSPGLLPMTSTNAHRSHCLHQLHVLTQLQQQTRRSTAQALSWHTPLFSSLVYWNWGHKRDQGINFSQYHVRLSPILCRLQYTWSQQQRDVTPASPDLSLIINELLNGLAITRWIYIFIP